MVFMVSGILPKGALTKGYQLRTLSGALEFPESFEEGMIKLLLGTQYEKFSWDQRNYGGKFSRFKLERVGHNIFRVVNLSHFVHQEAHKAKMRTKDWRDE